MLTIGLFVLAIASDPRPPRPSDEAMLALVAEKISGAVVVQSTPGTMPTELDGSRGICGIARIGGELQPFFVYTFWRPGDPVESGEWRTTLRAPLSAEATSHNNFERRGVRSSCPDMVAPEGAHWPTDPVTV